MWLPASLRRVGGDSSLIPTVPGPAGELWAAKRDVSRSPPAFAGRVRRRASAGRGCDGQHPGLRHPPPERRPSSPVAPLKRVEA